jgi:hypothetical protein
MAESAYTVRAVMRTEIYNHLVKLKTADNVNGQISPADAAQWEKGLNRILANQFTGTKDNGMLALLDATNSPKLTETITADDIMKADTTSPAKFSSRAEAQEEANNQNLKNQAMMGAKQGVADAFVHKFGPEITDPILRTPDGDEKGIDEFTLHELMQAVKDATDRPQASAILASIREATLYKFNFRQKINTNVEQLNRRLKELAAHGTPLTPAHIALIVMANIEHAEKHPYGRDFRPALQAIRAKYSCNHEHDDSSLKFILAELAKADTVRSLREAPAPDQANDVSFVRYEIEDSSDDDNTYVDSAYTATSGVDEE